MHDIQQQATELQQAVAQALERLHFAELTDQKQALDARTMQPDFWNDTQAAQEIVKQQAKLEQRIAPWQSLKTSIDDVVELAALNDESVHDDLQKQLATAENTFTSLKDQLKFSGPYDDYDAIVSIYAGAGGTDAQDWAGMLLRMYVRWAEKQGYKVATIEESAGDEAGLKSATIEISGPFAYGKLQGEHGVHRLVRLSPFNADNLRQTSFAKVDVLPKVDQPDQLTIDDKDVRIDVYRSGGHGGQSVNTTDSAVRVTHVPTGITVAIQNERSQLQNKEVALTILRSRLAQLQLEQHQAELSDLKGPNQSAEWGNQIRSYVLHPYTMVKDLRTRYETSDAQGVLDGNLDPFVVAYLDHTLGQTNV
ncbi:MAG TPA: peptide chain release factor 2 [Candidatus Saccharimonadales bacterium]|jgi:peptide chain release factor 2|nr:peptide chain release factor 2 [Candidatus Saccharimonadales bacterium]